MSSSGQEIRPPDTLIQAKAVRVAQVRFGHICAYSNPQIFHDIPAHAALNHMARFYCLYPCLFLLLVFFALCVVFCGL